MKPSLDKGAGLEVELADRDGVAAIRREAEEGAAVIGKAQSAPGEDPIGAFDPAQGIDIER